MTFEPIWSGIIACYLFLGGLGGGAFATSAFLAWRHPEAVNMRKEVDEELYSIAEMCCR